MAALSRAEFYTRLAAAGRDVDLVPSLEEWLDSIVVEYEPVPILDEGSLLIDWAYSLDAWLTLESNSDVSRLARDYAAILELQLSVPCLYGLGEIALSADRLVDVGARRLAGKLTDGAWVAFLANSRLPPAIKATMGRWSVVEVSELVVVLRAVDYERVAEIFGPSLCEDVSDAA